MKVARLSLILADNVSFFLSAGKRSLSNLPIASLSKVSGKELKVVLVGSVIFFNNSSYLANSAFSNLSFSFFSASCFAKSSFSLVILFVAVNLTVSAWLLSSANFNNVFSVSVSGRLPISVFKSFNSWATFSFASFSDFSLASLSCFSFASLSVSFFLD